MVGLLSTHHARLHTKFRIVSPRSGEMVAVVGSKRHAGADHLVIRQPDRTLALLPVWMAAPAAASHQLVSPPRLSIESLAEVRALVDALLASSGRESSRRKGAGDAPPWVLNAQRLIARSSLLLLGGQESVRLLARILA